MEKQRIDPIWKTDYDLDQIRQFTSGTLVEHLGIRYVEKGRDFLKAVMPVDERTIQPLGLLHGGASVVLAESLGSMASHMTLDENHYSVGLEIKANHIRSAKEGLVTGMVRPVHLGRTTQIWDIEIKNDRDQLVCVSRLTMVVLER
ncbi:MAG: hotdog fold thioesterase [Desulfobacteraceae bacterium]|nr:MAG: hotdog fold thioesterase [Desulfobacteraceae bacterium]